MEENARRGGFDRDLLDSSTAWACSCLQILGGGGTKPARGGGALTQKFGGAFIEEAAILLSGLQEDEDERDHAEPRGKAEVVHEPEAADLDVVQFVRIPPRGKTSRAPRKEDEKEDRN